MMRIIDKILATIETENQGYFAGELQVSNAALWPPAR
jgi:hypothetical protein